MDDGRTEGQMDDRWVMDNFLSGSCCTDLDPLLPPADTSQLCCLVCVLISRTNKDGLTSPNSLAPVIFF